MKIGVKFGVAEWVKRNTLRWFEHTERMKSEELVKEVYVREIVGPNSRGRLLGRWKDRVMEYMKGVQVLGEGWDKQGGSVWIGGTC